MAALLLRAVRAYPCNLQQWSCVINLQFELSTLFCIEQEPSCRLSTVPHQKPHALVYTSNCSGLNSPVSPTGMIMISAFMSQALLLFIHLILSVDSNTFISSGRIIGSMEGIKWVNMQSASQPEMRWVKQCYQSGFGDWRDSPVVKRLREHTTPAKLLPGLFPNTYIKCL